MKKLSIVFLILINCLACSNGQIKPSLDNTQNLSTEILGCWRLVDAKYEIKSNYSDVDSLSLENRRIHVTSLIEKCYITKFYPNNLVLSYLSDGTVIGQDLYYEMEGDSLSIENPNTLRTDTRSSSEISISNDTLYLETNIFGEMDKVIGDLFSDRLIELKVLNSIKIEVAKRYTKFVRVKDCDQYKKEDE